MLPLQIVIGVSTFLGFASLLAYLYYDLQVRRAERSISSLIQGEALFNAKQIVQILAQFKDDASRLEALKTLTSYGTAQASALLQRVKTKVDVQSLVNSSTNHKNAGLVGMFFLALALVVVIFYKWPFGGETTPASAPTARAASSPASEKPAIAPPIDRKLARWEELNKVATDSDAKIASVVQDIRFAINSSAACFSNRRMIESYSSPTKSLGGSRRRPSMQDESEYLQIKQRMQEAVASRERVIQSLISEGIQGGCIAP